ncbi:MAG: hypothetical protein V3T86_07675 [Planctomycetota bacterium]
MADREKVLQNLGKCLLIAWVVLFAGGAIGELLGVDFLREYCDVKSIFLR